MRMKRASVKDFWEHVRVMDPSNPNSCWLFEGPTDLNGYGMYKGMLAHRIAAAIYTRSFPGKVVRKDEVCNNRLCVRKDHFDNVFMSRRVRASEIAMRERILEARGEGRYTIESMREKLGPSIRIDRIKAVLREQAMFDILEDIKHYVNQKMEVPITPETRSKLVTA